MVQARRQLKRVVCSDAIAYIAQSAFDGCEQLEDVVLPANMRFEFRCLGDSNPKLNCADLLQQGITPPAEFFAYDDAYIGCKASELTVPQGVKKLGDSVFYNGEMRKVILPDGLLEIGRSAFTGCKNLQEIVLPDGLRTIGDKAFCLCKKLKKVKIPDSVVSIGFQAFDGCSSLMDLWIGAGTVIQETTQSPGYPEKESPYSCSYNHLGTHITIHAPKGSPAAAFAKKYGVPLVLE